MAGFHSKGWIMCDLCRADENYFHTAECVYDQLVSEYPVMWLRDSTRIGACYTLRELLSPEGMVLAIQNSLPIRGGFACFTTKPLTKKLTHSTGTVLNCPPERMPCRLSWGQLKRTVHTKTLKPVTFTQRDKKAGMEGKTETFIKTSVDDNGMWLLTVPAGSTGDETVVVVVRRVEECRYGSEDSPGHICRSPPA
jgi:hypothetical protein